MELVTCVRVKFLQCLLLTIVHLYSLLEGSTEFKVNSTMQIMEGDVIKFGHMNGAAVRPGQTAPQVKLNFFLCLVMKVVGGVLSTRTPSGFI